MIYKINENIEVVKIVDGVIILDQRSGNYWALNLTGKTTVEGIVDGLSVEAIIEKISQVYQVAPAIVKTDVLALISEMESTDLVRKVGE